MPTLKGRDVAEKIVQIMGALSTVDTRALRPVQHCKESRGPQPSNFLSKGVVEHYRLFPQRWIKDYLGNPGLEHS